MFKSAFYHIPCLVLIASSVSLLPQAEAAEFTIGNKLISRTISDDGGQLKTVSLKNAEMDKTIPNADSGEFSLTYSIAGKSRTVTSADFKAGTPKDWSAEGVSGKELVLSGKDIPLNVVVRYGVKGDQPVLWKKLEVTAQSELVLNGVQIENLGIADAYTAYRPTDILAFGPAKWTPPLGQPVYTKESGMWFGTEFPAARNHAKDGKLYCGYKTKTALKKGDTWSSYPAVMGVADDTRFLKDAFFEYIDTVRIRPLRLQTQYNSWFDFHKKVDSKGFVSSVNKVNDELVVKRGVPPLSAYVIDDGWQNSKADWSKTGVWPKNNKFEEDFKSSREAIAKAKSKLGLWVSPGCNFGGQPAIPAMKKAGWKTLDPWMSLIGEQYMSSLEKRMTELAGSPVSYFKLDGLFGHLRARNFDIEGFKGGEEELNANKYDEAKELYLSLGTERLMAIFAKMAEANPDVYITISNGAYLSPWWLQSVDAVWMINAGDAARGSGRTDELVYRDGIYYRLFAEKHDNTQFPIHSLFNHEPKKTSTGESADEFRRYLYMNLSRGTGFVELYLITKELSESDWDVLAEGLKWVHKAFPTFQRARMIGGYPRKKEVYGFTGWTDDQGYLSLHNPGEETKEFTFTLNRENGLTKTSVAAKTKFSVASPLKGDAEGLSKEVTAGESITITLPPRAIRVIDFNRVR
ncbi:hypothetical protein NT6N_13360 [Oceaniferula spumae]|uniref:Alpha-galactosidase n=1 Tax=Oceaniferula spumae TaxID=2979115 RepID=A0AAT9FK21_9BACT